MAALDPEAEEGEVGLCHECRHVRVHRSRRSVFYRCARAEEDPSFPKYPPLPVRVCSGHELASGESDPPRLSVSVDAVERDDLVREATEVSRALGVPFEGTPDRDAELLLVRTADRWELRWSADPDSTSRRSRPIYVDLCRRDVRSSAGRSRRQPIARAVGLRRGAGAPDVVDATAGFGDDSALLASLGCRVVAVERHPVVALLLADGLRRWGESNPRAAEVRVLDEDARSVLRHLEPRPEVVYLDPMFPPRKGSARESKRMRLLRCLVGADEDARSLFTVALEVASRRVVVKRPRHAEPLDGAPASSHAGKSLRYDVYPTS